MIMSRCTPFQADKSFYCYAWEHCHLISACITSNYAVKVIAIRSQNVQFVNNAAGTLHKYQL